MTEIISKIDDVQSVVLNGEEGEFYSRYEWVEEIPGLPGAWHFIDRYFRADPVEPGRMTDAEWLAQQEEDFTP